MADNQDFSEDANNLLSQKSNVEFRKTALGMGIDLEDNSISKEVTSFVQTKNLPTSALLDNELDSSSSVPKSKSDSINSAQFSEALSEIIQRLNKKREKDQNIHDQFQECFNEQLNQFQTKVLEMMRIKYEKYSKEAQEKLNKIFDSLNRIKKLELEIKTISNEVEHLYKIFNQ